MRNIHNYDKRMSSSLEKTKSLSDDNQKSINVFVKKCQLEELSSCRIGKYVYLLNRLAEWLGKDFDKANKKDIEDLILKISKMDYNAWTVKDYKITIKKFYKSLGKEELVSWIKTNIKRNIDENLPNEVYTTEEIDKLIDVANNPRDKLLISLLYESGCRISELLNVKIKDIKFEDDYAMINVMGKTGNRSIPISKSIPLLKTWLNYYDKDKETYLLPLEYKNTSVILQKLFKKAGIDKPCNPHQFRHSRATELAKQLTEAQMKQFFGWTQNSNMAGVYVHLTGRDLVPKLITETRTKKCLKCGFENPMTLKFCSECLMPLDSKGYKEKVEIEEIMKNMTKLANYDKEWLEFTAKRMQRFMK